MSPLMIRMLCLEMQWTREDSIGRTVAGDDCCAGVVVKCSFRHFLLYFLDSI